MWWSGRSFAITSPGSTGRSCWSMHLQAINAGPEAVADLETALTDILSCFRPGRASLLSPLIGRRIDRILFAATKADHLHHENHDRLEAVLGRLVDNAISRARFAGAKVEVLAIGSGARDP